MKETILLIIGIVIGWSLRYWRDTVIFKQMNKEMEKMADALKKAGITVIWK